MKYFLLAILIFLLLSCKEKESSVSPLGAQIDSIVLSNTQRPFNGAVLIAKNGKIVYTKDFGYANIENKIPFDSTSQFVVGSVSKQFTATIILQEYDKGRLDLHTPIRKYLPQLTQSWADTVTVHHLLTHTHGIVDLSKPTLFNVGTEYNYSQIGYDLLAQIAEKTSGKTFVELSSALFSTCNLHNTFHPDANKHKHLVIGYVESDSTLVATDKGLDQYPAAGSFISTAQDLHLWNEKLFGGHLLKAETLQMMTTAQDNAIRNHPVFGVTKYGYGITVENKDNITQWGQTGFTPGFTSMNFYFPQTRTSVIVLENINYDVDDLKKTFEIHTNMLDLVKETIKADKEK